MSLEAISRNLVRAHTNLVRSPALPTHSQPPAGPETSPKCAVRLRRQPVRRSKHFLHINTYNYEPSAISCDLAATPPRATLAPHLGMTPEPDLQPFVVSFGHAVSAEFALRCFHHKTPRTRGTAQRRPRRRPPPSRHNTKQPPILGTKYFYLVPTPRPHFRTPHSNLLQGPSREAATLRLLPFFADLGN